jgi:uncharacterized protein (DUF362 family)
MGTPKASGVLIFGNDPLAVNAACCRVMGLLSERAKHLARAGTFLGHSKADKIQQLGESIGSVQTHICRSGTISRLKGVPRQFGIRSAPLKV